MVAPQAAALPLASKVALPAMKSGGIFTAAMGLSAALTALKAFTMPAPQVVVVHAHSTLETWTARTLQRAPRGLRIGVALALMRAINCGGVRLALTARMSAAMPDTMGAEKLVPKFELV